MCYFQHKVLIVGLCKLVKVCFSDFVEMMKAILGWKSVLNRNNWQCHHHLAVYCEMDFDGIAFCVHSLKFA